MTALKNTGRNSDAPVGAILPFHQHIISGETPLPLPDGWGLCDGGIITDPQSPLVNCRRPDLNAHGGIGRFLRGGITSGINQNATQVTVNMETNHCSYFWHPHGHATGENRDFDSEKRSLARCATGGSRSGAEIPAKFGPQIYAGRVRPKNMSVVYIVKER